MFEELKRRISVAEEIEELFAWKRQRAEETIQKPVEDDYDRAVKKYAETTIELLNQINKVLQEFVKD